MVETMHKACSKGRVGEKVTQRNAKHRAAAVLPQLPAVFRSAAVIG